MKSNIIKKISIFTLLIMMLIGNFNGVYADTNLTLEEKADILNELGIMKGNGTSYDLDGNLLRSHAATFIVRLIGREQEALENSSYKYTEYTDVSTDAWYAPYVGYCEDKGIINGYSDGTFKPDDYVSEKAFLKLVLTSLQYEYGKDFDWGQVYGQAYTVGIVKDSSYKTKEEDNNSYTRSDVVEVLYEALRTVPKGENKRVVQLFIDSLIISKTTAKEYNLIVDEIDTKIESIEAINETDIKITFNESIPEFTDENIKIVNEADEEVNIDQIEKLEDGLVYQITLEGKQGIEELYKVTLGDLVDQYNNTSDILYQEFYGYRPDEIESELFMINKVEAVSNNIIYVYFTQPVNNNALQPNYYSLTSVDNSVNTDLDLTITQLTKNNHGVSVYLNNYRFTEEGKWKISIDGKLTSAYGVRLNQSKGDSLTFDVATEENDPLTLEDIETINETTIQLTFNKQVNGDLVKQTHMYYLRDTEDITIPIVKATVDSESGEKVFLYTDEELDEDEEYKIMINHMQDITGQFVINMKDYSFEVDIDDVDDLEIDDVDVYDSNLLYVYFNKSLDSDTATDTEYYDIYNNSDSIEPAAVYYNKVENPYLVKIYLAEDDSMEDNEDYIVRILEDYKDEQGNELSNTISMTFENRYDDHADVIIEKATIIGEDTIKLEFSQELAKDFANIENSNYSLLYYENGIEYVKTPISVTYYNPRVLVLKFDSLDFEEEYTISFKTIVNYGGISNDDTHGDTEVTIGN